MSIKKASGLALLAVAIIVNNGCSTEPAKPVQPLAANSSPTAVATQAATDPVAPSSFPKIDRLNGRASDQFDSIVKRVSVDLINAEERVAVSLMRTLAEDFQMGEKYATTVSGREVPVKVHPGGKVEVTASGFGGRDTIESDKGACAIAIYSDKKAQIEFASGASKGKIVSPLASAVAKVYCDLALPDSDLVIPAGTMLRREAKVWVSFRDQKAEKRLDALK